MRALENSVLMRIYLLRSSEITGGCIRFHNEELILVLAAKYHWNVEAEMRLA
jgi:hypothetical protein